MSVIFVLIERIPKYSMAWHLALSHDPKGRSTEGFDFIM